MADVFHFVPRAGREVEENLRVFIEKCRSELNVFGADLPWSDWHWPQIAQFTKLGTKSHGVKPKDLLDPEFIEFAKAYFRYQQGHRPTRVKWEALALKVVEAALRQVNRRAAIAGISLRVLDECAALARQHYSKGAGYQVGRELERLARFVVEKRLVPADVSHWKNPLPRANDRSGTGKRARRARENRLPKQETVDALAEIFANDPSDPKDIFTSSTFAMTMCAPVRISEVLELPADCEVEEEDSEGNVRYGWRYYAGKGYGSTIKWIPTEMVPIAKQAVSRIRRLTEPARALAQWIESNPATFYPHADCPRVPATEPLTDAQICAAIGWRSKPVYAFSQYQEIFYSGPTTLNSLWQYVLRGQPTGFPWLSELKKIQYSNALFCMTRNMLHAQRGTSPVFLWKVTHNIFNNDLSPRETLQHHYHQSIFDRHGYRAADGSRLKLKSHEARHLLSTIAERGGLSQLQLAKWAGRADSRQNRTYNHMTDGEMVERAQALDTSRELFGPTGSVAVHKPATVEEFELVAKGPVHVTEFGFCVHDFVMSPCEKYRDCLNCDEQVCVKGDDEHLRRIKERARRVEEHYQAAKAAIEVSAAGADRWYQYHAKTLARLWQLISILENPEIEDGALIKLSSEGTFSTLRRAAAAKLQPRRADSVDSLERMIRRLGGGLG